MNNEQQLHPFISSLCELARRQDRAALADLRRGLTHPLSAMPYVVRFVGADHSAHTEKALILVGGLFALHPSHGSRTLPTALADLARKSDSVALRFRALLDSESEDVGVHLRHAVTLVRSKEMAINYDDLLRAVRAWGHQDKYRQRAWARDFWGRADDAQQEEETTS